MSKSIDNCESKHARWLCSEFGFPYPSHHYHLNLLSRELIYWKSIIERANSRGSDYISKMTTHCMVLKPVISTHRNADRLKENSSTSHHMVMKSDFSFPHQIEESGLTDKPIFDLSFHNLTRNYSTKSYAFWCMQSFMKSFVAIPFQMYLLNNLQSSIECVSLKTLGAI